LGIIAIFDIIFTIICASHFGGLGSCEPCAATSLEENVQSCFVKERKWLHEAWEKSSSQYD